MGDMRNTYNSSFRKPEGQKLLGRPKFIWENNIKLDLEETIWEGMNWIRLGQSRGQ
jgi:hypothetical protein